MVCCMTYSSGPIKTKIVFSQRGKERASQPLAYHFYVFACNNNKDGQNKLGKGKDCVSRSLWLQPEIQKTEFIVIVIIIALLKMDCKQYC